MGYRVTELVRKFWSLFESSNNLVVIHISVYNEATVDIQDSKYVIEALFVLSVLKIGNIPRPHLIRSCGFKTGRFISIYWCSASISSHVNIVFTEYPNIQLILRLNTHHHRVTCNKPDEC